MTSDVTSAQWHQSEWVFRFPVSGPISDNPPGYFLPARVWYFFLPFLLCWDVNSGAPPPDAAHPAVWGWVFLLTNVVFFLVVNVFVNYIPLGTPTNESMALDRGSLDVQFLIKPRRFATPPTTGFLTRWTEDVGSRLNRWSNIASWLTALTTPPGSSTRPWKSPCQP
jgi:hypothetical protein